MSEIYKHLPTLQSKSDQLKVDINTIKQRIENVKNDKKYDDAESLREHELKILEQEYEATLDKAEEDFAIELEALELNLAEQAFKMPDIDEEQATQSNQLASIIKSQLQTSINKAGTVELLKTRIKTMSDADKQAVKMALVDVDFDGKDEIMERLNDTAHMRNIKEQMDALNKIRSSRADSLRSKYDTIDRAVKKTFEKSRNQGQSVSKDFYEKHLKGRA